MSASNLLEVRAVLDGGEPLLIGAFEPASVGAVLALMRDFPFEVDGALCHCESIQFTFGANGDRPHFEVIGQSAEGVAASLRLFALEDAAPALLAAAKQAAEFIQSIEGYGGSNSLAALRAAIAKAETAATP